MELAVDLGNIVFGLIAGICAALVWAGQQKTSTSDHSRRLLALETQAASQAHDAALVARLEERINGLSAQIANQPQIIAVCVGTAIKEALRFNQARAV